MPIDPRTPCLIGVAQRTWRDREAPEPLQQWAEVALAAAADSGAADVLPAVDSVQVVHCLSWPYDDPPTRLADRIAAPDGHRLYSGIGGTTPQVLVGRAAASILDGDLDLVLIAGGEALATKRRAKKRGERVSWSHRNPEKVPFPLEAPLHPSEIAHQLLAAYHTFATFDVARRAHRGVAPEAYRRQMGELLAPMTATAAANPHAWFPVERSAHEIISPTTGNRMVGYPYTKYMVAIMDVDMAAALLVASEEKADELGVPRDRRVYLRGWAYGTEVWNVAERDQLWASPGIERVAGAALGAAGVSLDEVSYLDLYSCFSSSVLLALDALGLAADDPRPLTVTGGLPYAGGPANNYMGHSIAAMAERLRGDPGSVGVVSGVGMHLTKHVYGVYSTGPGEIRPVDGDALQAQLDDLPQRHIEDSASGPATIASYTMEHTRQGEPSALIAVCDLPGGARCYARTTDDDLLAAALTEELVGVDVELEPRGDGVNELRA